MRDVMLGACEVTTVIITVLFLDKMTEWENWIKSDTLLHINDVLGRSCKPSGMQRGINNK